MQNPEPHWELYEPKDADAVRALHEAQEKCIGRKMDFPELMEKPVLLAVVRRVGERISHVIYLEAEIEVCGLGQEPIPDEEWDKVAGAIDTFARHRKFRIIRAFVPKHLLEVKRGKRKRSSPLVSVLKRVGLQRDKGMVQFFRWLI